MRARISNLLVALAEWIDPSGRSSNATAPRAGSDQPPGQSTEPPDLERGFRALVESAPTAFVMADRSGHIALINAETEKLFGYGRDELIGQPVEILVPERFAPDHPELRTAFLADPSARPMGAGRDLFARRKDGSEFPVEIGLNPVETSRGLFVLSAIADITERKRLEQRFRATVESAPTAMVMVDRAGLIVLVNAETEKLFGYPRDELVGKAAEALVPERYRPHHAGLRGGFFAAPSARRMGAGRDLYARRKDGSEFPVEIGLNPVETEDGPYVLSAIADITERKRLEQRFRATVESAPTAMVMVDRAGLIVLVNAETEKLFGYPRDELVGKAAEVLVPERYRPHHAVLREGFFSDPSARRMGAGRDLYARRRDGSEFPVEIGLNPVETEDGPFVLSAIADITERKQLEQAQESLGQELQATNKALSRSNEVLQQFANITSHDLQEPLRMVASFTDLLARRYGDTLDEEGREYIHFANDGAKRMKRMIEDLLAFARVDDNPDGPTEADSAAILSEVLKDLTIAMEECGAQVRHGDLPKVLVAPTHLKQLIQNIVSNAIKFRDEAPPEIDVEAFGEDGMYRFTIADNGIGMDPSYGDRIFEVFRRLHSHERYPGNGIGLATCKKIVERYGGRIWVETDPGQGSRFHFTLPGETRQAA